MIQNSRSPVVKSRISSLSGRTIKVEKRSLACTGTMSSRPYFTMRAPSVSAKAGEIVNRADNTTSTANRESNFVTKDMVVSPLVSRKRSLRVLLHKPTGNRLDKQNEGREQSSKHDREVTCAHSPSLGERRKDRNHGAAPASTLNPFSNP